MRKTDLPGATTLPHQTEVAIVGGGPVGLTLACLLTLLDVPCVVLERRTVPVPHSRAIGIHPPALQVLQTIGIADDLVRRGVQIQAGRVFYNDTTIGQIPLNAVHHSFPFVLSVPQTVTEAVLEKRLGELAPRALQRGMNFIGQERSDGGTYVRVLSTQGGESLLRARYLVACDGKNSALRQSAGIAFPGGSYTDCYLMGDFADDTPFGSDAALFMTRGGIVESFPLPDRMRRWVARLPERLETNDSHDLAEIVHARTGFRVPVDTCIWTSSFGIEHYLAEEFHKENVFLAGDAAHVVSPIGGQGMNLGFLDAAHLAPLLKQSAKSKKDITMLYEPRRKAAKIALRRAEWNTFLGRPCPAWHPHRALVWAMGNLPVLQSHFAGVFTMRGV